jgi:polysaccharide biosynthesis transport protein
MHARSLPAPPAAQPDLEIRELLRVLGRRKGTILAIALAGALTAEFVGRSMDPVYTSSAKVMIAPGPMVVEFGGGPSLAAGSDAVQSEVEVLRSRDLAARVVDTLHLVADPEFNALLRAPKVPWWKKLFGGGTDTQPAEPVIPPAAQREAVIGRVLGHLELTPVGRSRVISVEAASGNPEKAAAIANTWVDEYLRWQVERKQAAASDSNTWLRDRVAQLQDEVKQKEAAVEAYRTKAGLLQAGASRLSDQEVSQIASQLVVARADQAAAEARLSQVESLLAGGGPRGADKVIDSPVVSTLRVQEAQLRREIAQMADDLGPEHPRLKSAQAQLQDLQSSIRLETDKSIQELRNAAAVARARTGTLAGSLDRLSSRTGELNVGAVQLRALEREADASRALLEHFLTRSKETAEQASLHVPDAQVIARASAPLWPTSPNRRLLLMLGTTLALVAGVLIALMREGMQDVVHSRDRLESTLGVVGTGAIPTLRRRWWRREVPHRAVLRAPHSSYAEALRRVHTTLLLGNPHSPPRLIMVTSALPDEGKTTTVLALGRLLANAGYRVAAVDLNLRRPTLHRAAGIRQGAGFAQWHDEEYEFGAIMRRDPHSPLDILPAGKLRTDPSLALRSQRFEELMTLLRTNYDVVLLDSSPLLAVAEAQIVAAAADQVVYLVRAGTTTRTACWEGYAYLRAVTSAPPFPVLNAAAPAELYRRGRGSLAAYYGEGQAALPRGAAPRRHHQRPAALEWPGR